MARGPPEQHRRIVPASGNAGNVDARGQPDAVRLPEGYESDYYDDVKAQLAKRLHLARLFYRKLAPMPFELADPVWIDDDDIDLDYHVRSVTLRKPGTMAQLEVLVARLR